MCNCNSSFCAVCCRRVKAYRFDNVPEITGDLQLYTEFYKVGEAYGHWKFTIDDLEAYLDIPTVLWNDKLVAFGHTATGGLFYNANFVFDYTTSSLTVGTRGVGTEGLYSASFGNNIVGDSSLAVGDSNEIGASSIAVGSGNFGGSNNIFLFGDANSSSQRNATIFGDSNMSSQQKINIFGYNLTASHGGNAMFSDAIGGSSSIADNAFTAQFAGGYRFRLDASSTAVNISSTGIVTIDNVVNNNTENQLLVWNVTTKEVEYREVSSLPGGGGGSGTVTSVDAAFLNGTALTVVGGAITTAGTFDFEWQGLNTDYVAGDGSIIAFPTLTSGTVTSVSAGNGMTFTTITTSGAVTLGTPSSITLASTNSVGVGTHSHLFAPGGTTAQYIRGDGTLATTPLGSVTSVGMTITAATALSVAGSPITTSGTFAVTWTGSNTQYVAGDGSLITFPTLTSGTVTAVNSGAGMDFTNFTTSGTIILGTPSTITLASVNGASGTTHSHEFDLGGTAGQYLAGDTTLQTFPTIPTVNWADKKVAFGKTSDGGLSYATNFIYDYTSEVLSIGGAITNTGGGSFLIGYLITNSGGNVFINGYSNTNYGNDSFISGRLNSISLGSDYGSIIGTNNQITGTSPYSHIKGNLNVINTAQGGFITGRAVTINHAGVNAITDFVYDPITSSAANQFIGRFAGGYVFNLTASSTAVAINSSGQIVANFVPSSPSSTDIIVRGGGNILSTRTVSSLPFTNNTGTVTNFSANDLTTFTDPLFTVNVTNPTTTPDLTFTLPTLTQKLVFAAPWGVSGQPFWRQLLPSDLSRDGASTGQVITWNGTAWVPQNAASGGVTSVSAGNGMNFTTITTTGAVTMGTPSSITLSSTNGFPSATTHTHAFAPGGNATTQYITGSGTLASNLWTLTGSDIYRNSNVMIGSTSAPSAKLHIVGSAEMIRIQATNSYISFFDTAGTTRQGYIEMSNGFGFFNITAENSNKIRFFQSSTETVRFTTTGISAGIASDATQSIDVSGTVRARGIATATDTNLVTTDGYGVFHYRTIASLTGLTTDVFKIQGGTTNASAITDDIYHNGKLKLGTSTSSAYQLSVSGTGYFTSTVDFNNNVGVQGFTTGAVIKNLVKLNSSNQEEIGVSGTDIILPAYLNSRTDGTVPGNTLYTTSAGVLQSRAAKESLNAWAKSYYGSTGQTIAANSTYTDVTATGSTGSSFNPYSFSSNWIVPLSGWNQIMVVIHYQMDAGGTGTPEVFGRITVAGSDVGDTEVKIMNLGTHWQMTLLGTCAGNASPIKPQLKVTTGTGAIKVMKMMTIVNYSF